MTKLTLSSVASLTNEASALATLNANSVATSAAVENTLSRDGSTPNTMAAPIDMNGNTLLNLPPPVLSTDPVRFVDLLARAAPSTAITGTSGHTVPYLDGTNTFSGIDVFSNTTDITGPNPAYFPASGGVQMSGGLSVTKSFQALGGKFYLGNGTSTTGFSGTVIFNLNSYNSGAAAGAAIDFDNVNVQTMTFGNFSAVTNGLVSGAYDPTPTLKSNMTSGSLFRLVKHITNSSVLDAINIDAVTLSPTFGGPVIAPGVLTNSDALAGNVGEYKLGFTGNSSVTFTVNISTPSACVILQAGHGYSNTGTGAFQPSTTGALPTGIVAGNVYWTIPGTVTPSTFQIATSIANAFAGIGVVTTGSQSGTHTGKSSAPCTTAADTTCAAIQLTAGDWDVSGMGGHDAANTTVITQLITILSLTLASDFVNINGLKVNFVTTGSQTNLPVASFRVSVPNATTQIIYCNAFDTFATSTCRLFGKVSARRAR